LHARTDDILNGLIGAYVLDATLDAERGAAVVCPSRFGESRSTPSDRAPRNLSDVGL